MYLEAPPLLLNTRSRMLPSPLIPLPFTVESALQVLAFGRSPSASPYSHKQIAEWCDRFWCQYIDVDAPPDIERLLPLLTDVETQWDLYLVNTFSTDQLKSQSFEHVALPVQWFEDWLWKATQALGRHEGDA